MPDKLLSLQDQFLNSIRRSKSPALIFLMKGVKLQGVITWFDAFSLLLRRESASQALLTLALAELRQAIAQGGMGEMAARYAVSEKPA